MKAVVAAFNQEKALVGAFSVIVQPVVEPMDPRVLTVRLETEASMCGAGVLVQDSNIAMSAALSIKLYKIF